jgi:hypothetical protein
MSSCVDVLLVGSGLSAINAFRSAARRLRAEMHTQRD